MASSMMSSPRLLSLLLLLCISLCFLSSSFSHLSRGEEVGRGGEEEEQKKRDDGVEKRRPEDEREDKGVEENGRKKNAATSLSLDDVIQSSLLVLDQLTPELSLKNSPLSIQSTQEEEDQLDRVDEGFSEREKLLKIIACFRLTQRHHADHRDTYKTLLEKLSPENGMREDEILKIVFHGAWVACHHNLRQEHSRLLARLISGEKISTPEKYSLLYRHPSRTPFRFSKKQHNFAEQTIRRFGRESPSGHVAINGWRGYLFSLFLLIFLFFGLLYVYRTLQRRRRKKNPKSPKQGETKAKPSTSSSSRGVEGVEEGEGRERHVFLFETGDDERGSLSLSSQLKNGRNAKASQKQRKGGRVTPPLTERNP